MFRRLDDAPALTINQIKIIAAAIIGDMLEFFDYYLIAFVLAFIIKPWHLTFLESAIILMSSGVGAILGAAIWGRIADIYGRRKVFILTVLNFSLASGLLAAPLLVCGGLKIAYDLALWRAFRRQQAP